MGRVSPCWNVTLPNVAAVCHGASASLFPRIPTSRQQSSGQLKMLSSKTLSRDDAYYQCLQPMSLYAGCPLTPTGTHARVTLILHITQQPCSL